MKNFWQNLNQRDRLALGVGVGVVAIYLLYLLIYAPIANRLEKRAIQHQEKSQTLTWMKQVRGQKITSAHPKALSNSQLLSLLATRLKNPEFGPFPYQLQQIGTGDIQLSFEEVPFIPFIKWLLQINQAYAFTIKQFNAQKTETSGLVKVTIIISAH